MEPPTSSYELECDRHTQTAFAIARFRDDRHLPKDWIPAFPQLFVGCLVPASRSTCRQACRCGDHVFASLRGRPGARAQRSCSLRSVGRGEVIGRFTWHTGSPERPIRIPLVGLSQPDKRDRDAKHQSHAAE